MDFSERLRELRQARGWTRAELGKRCGMSASTINMYERGERRPNVPALEALADAFNIDMNSLFGNTASPSDELLEELRTNTGKRILFDMLDTATEQDIQQVIAIVEALQKSKGNG